MLPRMFSLLAFVDYFQTKPPDISVPRPQVSVAGRKAWGVKARVSGPKGRLDARAAHGTTMGAGTEGRAIPIQEFSVIYNEINE